MKVLDVDIKYKVGSFKGFYRFEVTEWVTGIWGASGHGKTTLIQLIAGLLEPKEGTISMMGDELVNMRKGVCLSAHKRHIGVVFQDARLFPHLSVRQNLTYGMPEAEKCEIGLDDVVEVLGLTKLLDQKPGECSGGEKQRVALGRALLSQPKLLLLDEPFSALDKQIKFKAIDFIRKVIHTFKIPVVVISHDISDILMLTNKMLLIKKGKVEACGEFTSLLMQGYFEGTPLNDAFVNDLRFTILEEDEGSNFTAKLKGTDCVYYLHTESKKLEPGCEVDAFLRPEDITISTARIDGISMQNQLEAHIKEIYLDNNFALCLLDAGTDLLVQITTDSVQRLDLYKGKKVYALFKSVALTMYDDSHRMSLRR